MLDRHTNEHFKREALKYQSDMGVKFQEVKEYLANGFRQDVASLIECFEGQCPLEPDVVDGIETRLLPYLFREVPMSELVNHSIFQLFMACKMGFTKMSNIITFPEICKLEGISKQQLHRSTYNILDNPCEEERKHKMPAVKLHGNSFVFMRDFRYWQATRIRRK